MNPVDVSTIRVSALSEGVWTTERVDGFPKPKVVTDSLTTLGAVVESIRRSERLKTATDSLRLKLAKGGRKGAYEKDKLKMPAIIPAMQAPKGSMWEKMPIEHHNGVYGYDIDEHREDLDIDAVRADLINTPGAAMVGTSCGDDALYVLILGPQAATDAEHLQHWAAIAAGLPESARVNNAESSKNPNRLRFLAYDPGVWLASELVTPLPGLVVDAAPHAVSSGEQHPRLPPVDEASVDRDALRSIQPPQDYNDWFGWLPTLKTLGFSASEVEAWAAQGAKFQQGEVEQRWNTLPEDSPEDARHKLRGHAHNMGWRGSRTAIAHTSTYSNGQPAAPSPTTATISLGRSEWQFIGQVCADRLRGSFRYDVELDSFWQFTEGTHWRLITDKKRLTDPLTDQRLSIVDDLKDKWPTASESLRKAKDWHETIRSPLSEWWTEVRMRLRRPSPAPPDWQRATPGGVIDLRSGDIENHDPLVHDTLTVTRGEYRPDNANDLKDELFEKRLKHNITEEGYDSLLKLLGLAAARKAQELRAILWLHGKSGGGKGMVKNLLMASFHRCCGAVSLDMLERLSDDINAGLADLLEADPFLVLCDELGGPGIRERRLLSWTGNHPLSARRPHQTVPFTKTLRALWVCPTVDPPRLNSKGGFERRSAVIGFDRQFKGPGANEDFQQYEMDALVTWAVIEAVPVYKSDYEAPLGEKEKRKQLLGAIDPLQAWLDTMPGEWEWTPLSDIADRYGKEHNEPPPSAITVGRKLTNSVAWESHLPGRGQPKVLRRKRTSTPLFGEEA